MANRLIVCSTALFLFKVMAAGSSMLVVVIFIHASIADASSCASVISGLGAGGLVGGGSVVLQERIRTIKPKSDIIFFITALYKICCTGNMK
ncbi:hypothetical protein BMS3Abin03_00363 [bacterium BMS3Abin03]|nr:hypothetical protein BMS3Abin03_00363 [bacterium BMS3Abin03]